MKKLIFAALALVALAFPARAQTAWGFVDGQIVPAVQWNSLSAAKQNWPPSVKIPFIASTTTTASMLCTPGVAPTSPVTGDVWCTTAGMFIRTSTGTVGPFGAPLAFTVTVGGQSLANGGASTNQGTGSKIQTANGTVVTGNVPKFDASGALIDSGTTPGGGSSPATTLGAGTITFGIPTAGTFPYYMKWPWATGTITSISYNINGTTPAMTASLTINGVNVTGCSNISVTSATITLTTCTGANAITLNQALALTISGVTGSPTAASIQVTYSRSFPT